MANPFLAEIRIFPFNFAPRGWALCNGQLLSIAQNTALFSLIGTFYGGDGRSNFALPNFQGNGPVHQGSGVGLTLREVGETGGSDTVALLPTQIPAHNHTANCSTGSGDRYAPAGNYWATDAGGNDEYAASTNNKQMAAGALAVTGGGQPHNNLQPYLTLNFCIALQGIFPPRS